MFCNAPSARFQRNRCKVLILKRELGDITPIMGHIKVGRSLDRFS